MADEAAHRSEGTTPRVAGSDIPTNRNFVTPIHVTSGLGLRWGPLTPIVRKGLCVPRGIAPILQLEDNRVSKSVEVFSL